MTRTTIRVFSSDDIDKLNEDIWRFLYVKGSELTFGDRSEVKHAREAFFVVQLYGPALTRLYNGEVPKGWLFGGKANLEYNHMIKSSDEIADDDTEGQPYNYRQRAKHKNQFKDAMEALKESIETGIQTNRICGVIWWPGDLKLKSPPCWQWWQVRKLDKNNVSLRILFRSHAYDNAEFPNWGAILKAFIDEVVTPAGGVLEELICVSTSAEIEYGNFSMIESLIGWIPEHLRRLMK